MTEKELSLGQACLADGQPSQDVGTFFAKRRRHAYARIEFLIFFFFSLAVARSPDKPTGKTLAKTEIVLRNSAGKAKTEEWPPRPHLKHQATWTSSVFSGFGVSGR